MQIRKIVECEIDKVIKLVWDTFLEFEAPDYSEEGIASFKNCIYDLEFIKRLEIYGAFEERELQGVIATRNEGNHIALFFVRADCHRKGIGKRLFETMLNKSTSDIITVNSSPYAVAVYQRLGFVAFESEQLIDGIRFLPMRRNKTD